MSTLGQFLASLAPTLSVTESLHPPDSTSLPPYTTAAQVDEDIVKHISLVYGLLRRRNSFAFISCLPSEILETIFIHYACDYHEQNPFRVGVADWANVSYVCHHWRNVALNCPTLWTYHFLVSLRWTEEILARSKQAPLKICLGARFEADLPGLLEKLMDHVERIQQLQLRLPACYFTTTFFVRAPRLQHLEIEVSTDSIDWSNPVIFNGDTPALRTLRLVGCVVQWHPPVSSALTSLILRDLPPGSRLSMAEFRVALSRMQNLTVLSLHHALVDTHGLPSDKLPPKITLSRLVYLVVGAPPSTVAVFLSCVNIPSNVHFTLDFLAKNTLADDYAPIPPLLAQIFGMSENSASWAPFIDSVSISFNLTRPWIEFAKLEHTTDEWSADGPCVRFFDVDMPRRDIEFIMNDICCSLPLTGAQHLSIDNPPFPSAFWEKILGHLRGLRCIKLSNGNLPDISPLLSLVTHKPVETPDGHGGSLSDSVQHAFVPALEKLELGRIAFEEDLLIEYGASRSALFDAISTRGALRDQVTIIPFPDSESGSSVDGSDEWYESDSD